MDRINNDVLQKYKDERKKYLKGALILQFLAQIYTVLGALLFLYIEECNEKKTEGESKMEEICRDVVDVQNTTTNTSHSLDILIESVARMCRDGNELVPYDCEYSSQGFYRWWFYTFTVCSTIGYGNVVPRTDIGKLVTMIYAVPGIAVSFTSYSYLGRLINTQTKLIILHFQNRIYGTLKLTRLNLKVFFCLVCLTLADIFVFAWLASLKETEDLRFFDAVYFGVITYTTIGFGDFYYDFGRYIHHPHLIMPISTLLVIGLSLVASLITNISDVILGND